MTVVAVVGGLVVHNLVTNLWFSDRWYVPVNLATAGVLVAAVGCPGLSAAGWATGVAGVLVVLLVIALLAVVRRTRPLLADRRMAGVDARGTAWRALVRIPLGTVVLEEVAFRGVLPDLLSPVWAAALFGLWHVVPTVRTLEVNGLGRPAWVVAAAVAGTAAVGLVFSGLVATTGSLLAPAMVHAAANGGATVAAYRVLRSS